MAVTCVTFSSLDYKHNEPHIKLLRISWCSWAFDFVQPHAYSLNKCQIVNGWGWEAGKTKVLAKPWPYIGVQSKTKGLGIRNKRKLKKKGFNLFYNITNNKTITSNCST